MLELLERGDEVACPGPCIGEAPEVLSGGRDDVAGGVEQAVAEPFGLRCSETAVGVEE